MKMHKGLFFSVIGTGVFALSQVNGQNISPSKSAINEQPNRLKIELSISNPEDLKVIEGQQVNKGQVLSDRDRERKRLSDERKMAQLTIAKIEQTPLPIIKVVPAPRELPAVSFATEEAAVQQAELKFQQAQRNYATTLSGDPFITAKANLDFTRAAVEQAYRDVELQGKKIDAVGQIKDLPPEMLVHETEKLKIKRTEWEKKQAEYDFRAAEYKQVEQARKDQIASLQNNVEAARSELELAQAKLRAAKEKESQEQYNHQVTLARRANEENQSTIALSQQKLEREFKLAQLREQVSSIDEKLNTIALVRSPYNGTIKRIKTESQTDNTIRVTVSLVPNDGLGPDDDTTDIN